MAEKGERWEPVVQTPDKEKRLILHAVKNEQLIQSGLDVLFYPPVRIHAHYVRVGADLTSCSKNI